jgi:hypothetical protein
MPTDVPPSIATPLMVMLLCPFKLIGADALYVKLVEVPVLLPVVVPPVVPPIVVPPVVPPVVVPPLELPPLPPVEPLPGPTPEEPALLSKALRLLEAGATELSFEHDVKIDVESIAMPNITVVHGLVCLRFRIIIVKSIMGFCTGWVNQ